MLLKRILEAQATAKADAALLVPKVMQRMREVNGEKRITPQQSHADESSSSSSSSVSSSVSRSSKSRSTSTTASRKRKRRENDDDDDEDADTEDHNTEPLVRLQHVPHAALELSDIYIPLEVANEEAEDIIDYYRRKQALKHLRPEERCFICEYGNIVFDTSPDYGCRPFVRLLKYMKDHYGQAFNPSIGINMYEFYRRAIYEPALIFAKRHGITADEFPIPPMSVLAFQKHMEDMHTLNTTFIMGESLRELNTVRRILRARLVNRDEKQTLNKVAIDGYTKIMTLQHKYLTKPSSQLLFNTTQGDGLVLDPNKVGAMGNTQRVESLFKKNNTAIGGATAADATSNTHDTKRVDFNTPLLEYRTGADDDGDNDDDGLAAFRAELEAEKEAAAEAEPEVDAMDIDEFIRGPPSSPL